MTEPHGSGSRQRNLNRSERERERWRRNKRTQETTPHEISAPMTLPTFHDDSCRYPLISVKNASHIWLKIIYYTVRPIIAILFTKIISPSYIGPLVYWTEKLSVFARLFQLARKLIFIMIITTRLSNKKPFIRMNHIWLVETELLIWREAQTLVTQRITQTRE